MGGRLTRQEGWLDRFLQLIAQVKKEPFTPGTFDCAMFSASLIEAMTGVDLGARWRGKYSTLEEGHALVQEAGYADHIAVFAEALEEINPVDANLGDAAVVETPMGEAVGIVQGPYIYVLGPTGLGIMRRGLMTRAFKVG